MIRICNVSLNESVKARDAASSLLEYSVLGELDSKQFFGHG